MESFSIRFLAPHLWFGFLLLIPAILVALWTYHGLLAPLSRPARATLWALRALAFALVVIVLWQPVATIVRRDDGKPALAVLVDRSLSMQLPAGGTSRGDRSEAARDLLLRLRADLSSRYRLHWYGFNHELRSVRPDSLPGAAGSTSMGGAVQTVLERADASGLGGLVVVSDGVNTQGADPVRVAASSPVPIFTVAMGPDHSPPDLEIRRVDTNPLAFAGEPLPIRAVLSSTGLEGRTARIEVREEGDPRETREVRVGGGDGLEQEVVFTLKPRRQGVTLFEVRVTVDGDSIPQNDSRLVAVRVLERKTRVLCLADAVSWDFGFLRRVLDADTTLSYTYCVQDRPGHFRREGRQPIARVPSSLAELEEFAALVVVWSGGEAIPNGTLDAIGAFVRNGGGLLLLGGPERIAQVPPGLAEALPATIGGGMPGRTPLPVLLTSAGMRHPASLLRDNPADAVQWVASLPPLWPVESALSAVPGAETLLEFQSDRGRYPALVTRTSARGRSAWWAARGLWRWKLSAAGADLSSDAFQQLLIGVVHWVAEPVSRERIQVEPVRSVFQNGEAVTWTGSLWDAMYQPVSGGAIEVEVKGEADTTVARRVRLVPSVEAGRYEARGAALPAGAYRYRAGARGPTGDALGACEGRFWVESSGAEFRHPWSDRETLAEMARQSGGATFDRSTLGSLASSIPRVVRRARRTAEIELWNHAAVFVLFVCLLGTEWFLRRRRGLA